MLTKSSVSGLFGGHIGYINQENNAYIWLRVLIL